MRKMRNKQVSFILALLTIMVTVVSAIMPEKAYAEEGKYTLTLTNSGNTPHNFEIYQIFKGDLSDKTLSNIKWGEGVNNDVQDSLGDADKKAESLKGEKEAEAFAKELQNYLSTTYKSISIDPGKTRTVDKLEPGYYLVRDKAKSQDGKENGAYTSYILKVVKDTKATTKLDVPTVKKEVQENSTKQWGKVADYNIDEKIPYQLTGTLPENFDKYTTYKYAFNDEMSKGLTYNNDAKVYLVNDQEKTDITDKATINSEKTGSETTKLTVTFTDLKKIENITKDSKIVVEYSAKLNENAVIGGKGNDNNVYLEYSNNPNKDGDGETGTTPKDKSIVFTYKVIVNKKDEKKQPLQGAEFTLFKKEGQNEKLVKKFTIDDKGTQFTVKGLDAGEYILRETKTPDGYNTIKDVKFKITAEYDQNPADPKLKNLTGTVDLGTLEFTSKVDEGSLSTDVINKKGFTLPETGGMGRTLIYVMGGIFVVAALGYMGYKKRHAAR